MKVNYNQFLAIVYADMFNFPLTKREMENWSGAGEGKAREVQTKEGYYFLKGREKLVQLRKKRERASKLKLLRLFKILKFLKEIDTIEAVFVTGSVAVLNSSKDSDIDLMIVTTPGQLWQTRFKLLRKLKQLKLLRDKTHTKDRVCTNIFLDSEHLKIDGKNVYTAHEIVQARCVFDRGDVEKKWLVENSWVKEYLPSLKKLRMKAERSRKHSLPSILELCAFVVQYVYMWPKMTNEKVGLNYAFFHPVDGSKQFLTLFEKRLASLAAMR